MNSNIKNMNFDVIEDFYTPNLKLIGEMLDPTSNSCPVYIIRSYLSEEKCFEIKGAFNEILNETNGGNRQNDFVPVLQIGATQFNKTIKEYFEECKATKLQIKKIREALTDINYRGDFMLEESLKEYFSNIRVKFKPSSYNNQEVNMFTARKWVNKNNNSLTLLPHEDFSQLKLAIKDNYEIMNVKKVIACNLCISNKNEGELLIWNFEPSEEDKCQLGVQESGYPYPMKMLRDLEKVEIKINTGDLYFINANLVHAIKEVNNDSDRISLGRFIGFCKNNKVVYWT